MSKLPKNFYNNVDVHKLGIEDIADVAEDVAALETVVGDEDSGLVAATARNTERIVDLETTVGGVSSGLVKDVDDLQYQISHMHGIYHAAYTADTDPITVSITFTEQIGPDTLFDVYTSVYGIVPTSVSVSGQVATIVIPAQAADGVITLEITNPLMPE